MLTNRSVPPVTVTPVLGYPDVRGAVDWLSRAFGFEERTRIGEGHRAQLGVGQDGAVIVAEAHGPPPPDGAGASHVIKIRVEDVDAAFQRAQDAGARVIQGVTSYEYGERTCTLEDSGGHRWELSQTVRDVEPEEWGGVTVSSW